MSKQLAATMLRDAARIVHWSFKKDRGRPVMWFHEAGCHALDMVRRSAPGLPLDQRVDAYKLAQDVFSDLFQGDSPLSNIYWFGHTYHTRREAAITTRDHRVFALLLAAAIVETEGAI